MTQLRGDGQDTAYRPVWMLDLGGAGCMIVQALPFQPSINGASAPVLPVKTAPVATQKRAVAHDTPSRKPPCVCAGPEILPRAHLLPFQNSASRASAGIHVDVVADDGKSAWV